MQAAGTAAEPRLHKGPDHTIRAFFSPLLAVSAGGDARTIRDLMVNPTPLSPALQSFVDDELMRAPLLIEQTLEAVLGGLRRPAPSLSAGERMMSEELCLAISNQRLRVVSAYQAELQKQVAAYLASTGAPVSHKMSALVAPTLSLLDESAAVVDVVLARTIEVVRNMAEDELRELRSYTSALVGDKVVVSDHNPFRPEVQVRALWAAAQVLTPSPGFNVSFMHQAYGISIGNARQDGPLGLKVSFMHHAGTPLAHVLRRSYAASCSRLANNGVEPAAYRTLILPPGSRTDRRSHNHDPAEDETPDLQVIRETMPVPLDSPSGSATEFDHALHQAGEQLRRLPADAGKSEFGNLHESQRGHLMKRAASPVDQQLIELFSRLFDAIVGDRRLPRDIQGLVSRLQTSVLRVALRDPTTLDDHDHPVWQFLDRLAFAADTLPAAPDPERDRLLRLAQVLIEHVIGEKVHDAALYSWALSRLGAFERHRNERRVAAAAGQFAALQALDAQLVMAETPLPASPSTLDVQELDTVPAELLAAAPQDVPSAAADTNAWLARRAPAEWLRMFLQGSWMQAELLWIGEHRQLWLLADGASPRTWAVRRGALVALREAGLLESLKPRSLLRSAAQRLQRRINAG